MENTSSPQPSADTAPNGSPADPVAALDLILGETEVERAAQKIIMLRGFSDLALREAGRLDRAAEARAARLDLAETRLAAAPVAKERPEAEADTDTDTDEDAEEDVDGDGDGDAVERLQPSGGTSLALHRLNRMARLNILLEEKLIANLRAPKTGAAPKTEAAPKPRDKAAAEPSRWAKFSTGESAELRNAKALAREVVEDSAEADERLDPEDVEALLAEFDTEMASGKHDKALLKQWGNDVDANFLKARNIKPDYRKSWARAQAEMAATMSGRNADGTLRLRPAEYDEIDADAAPTSRPQSGDPGRATEPPGEPSGAGPPPLLP